MATMARTLLIAFLALLLVISPCHARPAPQQTMNNKLSAKEKVVSGGGVTAIYNFGDSLSDTGNLLREGATGMLRHSMGPPYGSAIGGATGRCSDGYLMIDFLAKDLGLPLLNPFLDKGADFTHGVNFAVAGATALDATALARRGVSVPHTNTSLAVQLQQFKDFMNANTRSPQEMREKLAHSLVMVGEIGGNDYNYAFSSNKPVGNGERNLYNFGRMVTGVVEAMALVPDVVRAVTSTARELLDMGATRLVIPGNFPLGCVPSYMSIVNEKDPAAYDANGCLASLNLFSQMHNVLLQHEIRELRRSYPTATIAYGDYFYAYVRMLRDAGKTGFDEGAVTKACCGAGSGAYNFDMDRMCGAPGALVCARPEERISWDGVHLTQHAYRVMADLLYHKGFASPAPVDFPRA
jgi:phospholipase/lecithinase/hemolysin